MSCKPIPRVTEITRPFWEGCNRQELLLQRCTAPGCGRYVFYPRVCCPYCGADALGWQQASGRGRIVSFTQVHRPHDRSFFDEAPYYYLAVRLIEGPILYSRLRGAPRSEAGLAGREVTVVFVDHAPGQRLPWFELAHDGGQSE